MTEQRGVLRARIEGDLRGAMKSRDTVSVTVLRSLLGALDSESAVPAGPAWPPVVNQRADVPRRELSEDETRDVIKHEAAELRAASDAYASLGQLDLATELRAKLAVVNLYTER